MGKHKNFDKDHKLKTTTTTEYDEVPCFIITFHLGYFYTFKDK